jgi:hypothetical protein
MERRLRRGFRVKTQGGAHIRIHRIHKMWGFPRGLGPEGVDDGGAAVWGYPERVEPDDTGSGERGL